ncbi:phosphoinositide phospholipase C 6-like [Rosa sericea]
MHGAQMVVSIVQGCDKSRWLMHGMFRANDEALPFLCTRAQMMRFLILKRPGSDKDIEGESIYGQWMSLGF